jgi:hypothetical protein
MDKQTLKNKNKNHRTFHGIGKPSPFSFGVSFAQVGGATLELISPHSAKVFMTSI